MRLLYGIVHTASGILLIFSISNFALAAPVPVLEQHQASVIVVQIPDDVKPVLGKRGPGPDEIEKLVEDFFATGEYPIGSSDTHMSSDPASPGPDDVSTDDMPALEPDPSITTHQGLWVEPSNPSSMQGAWGNPLSQDHWSHEGDDELHRPMYNFPVASGYGLDHELTGVHAPQPNPKSGLSEDNGPSTYSYFDSNYWFPPQHDLGQAHGHEVESVQQPDPGLSTNSYSDWNSPQTRPAPLNELGQDHGIPVENVQQPKTGPPTEPDIDWDHWMSLDDPPPQRPATPDIDWDHWMSLDDPPPPKQAMPSELDKVHETPVDHETPVENVHQPKTGPSTEPDIDWAHWMSLDDPPPPRPPTPDIDWDHWMSLDDPPPPRPATSNEHD